MSLGTSVHSKTHYSDGRYLVFKVENTLFRVSSELLARRSEGFREMLTMPTTSLDGSCDDHPIVLESILVKDFSNLMDFLAGDVLEDTMIKEPLPVDDLVSILKMCNLYDIKGGCQFVINELASRRTAEDFDAAYALQVSYTHRIPDFFKNALKTLLSVSVADYPPLALKRLVETDVLYQILQIHRHIDAHRKKLSLRVPASHALEATDCRARDNICRNLWSDLWKSCAIPLLLHTDLYMSSRTVFNSLEEMAQTSGICELCLGVALGLVAGAEYLGFEQETIDREVDRMYVLAMLYHGESSVMSTVE